MISATAWHKANRQLMAEERVALGDLPTDEEMAAYSRGEMSEADEERIRDFLVAYPAIARVYGIKF